MSQNRSQRTVLRRVLSVQSLRGTLLTVGAVLGTAAVLVALLMAIFDARALIFRSGSMAPAIDTGALAIAVPVAAGELAVGNVVSVEDNAGERVTHRIVAIEIEGRVARLTLRGDDNPVADAQTYGVTTADRVLFDVPRLGYVVSWFSGPIGLFVLGLYAAFLLAVIFGRGGRPPADGGKHEGRAGAAGIAVVALVAGTVAGLDRPLVEPTWATWTDSASATSGVFQAHQVQRAASMTCAGSGLLGGLLGGYYTNVVFKFPHKDTLYDYTARLYNSANVQVGLDIHISSGAASAGQDLTYALSSSNANGVSYVRIYSKLKGAPSWTSQQYLEWSVSYGSIVLVGVGVKCGADTQ